MATRAIPLSVIRKRADDVDRKIRASEAETLRLQIERELLYELMQRAEDVADLRDAPKKHARRPGATTVKIIEHVAANPGVEAMELADALHEQIESESGDKRRVVYNSTINLLNQGRLRKDESGGLHTDHTNEAVAFTQNLARRLSSERSRT